MSRFHRGPKDNNNNNLFIDLFHFGCLLLLIFVSSGERESATVSVVCDRVVSISIQIHSRYNFVVVVQVAEIGIASDYIFRFVGIHPSRSDWWQCCTQQKRKRCRTMSTTHQISLCHPSIIIIMVRATRTVVFSKMTKQKSRQIE